MIELNHILEKAKRDDLKIIDERLLARMELDLRVSMAWDTDMTDIDLHIYGMLIML